MAVEFGELLFRSLPGLYRDKDATGDLRAFLEIAALPLAEIEASVSQLHDDQFITTCRQEFVGLIGSLIGIEVDPALPEKAQRAEVQHAIERYRAKGLLPTLERLAEEVTGWRVNVVDFSQDIAQTFALDSTGPIRPRSVDVANLSGIERLGRADDTAAYSIDLRAARDPRERIGRKHLDNVGFFLTPCRVVINQRPNVLPPGARSGRFTFDGRALDPADANGVRLQLLDGIDGQPITRQVFHGHELDFCGARRGFTIRVNGVSVSDPVRRPVLRMRAANLEDFDHPRDQDGRDLPLDPRVDVAIDPQAGRFLLDLDTVKATPEQVQVDYLLGAIEAISLGPALLVPGHGGALFSFAPDGARVQLRDAFDGTPLAVSMRLGVPASEYHGTIRGWRIFRNGEDVSTLLEADIRDLPDGDDTTVPQGRIVVDPERGRFKCAGNFIGPADRVQVSVAVASEAARDRVASNLLQRLPRALPAGAVPVLILSDLPLIDPAQLS